MEQQQELEPMPQEQTEEVIRKRLNLEWVDSEWFQVWLKLARGEHTEQHK